ncbi:hypothetical protein WJX72_005471 [[Myrmecia] bisecta]|uniref:Uncharacterized protein n=1 Tax=[Myrmecia] bisecta TaxID=41462 RepID=A0AAW1QRF8_9CHLO
MAKSQALFWLGVLGFLPCLGAFLGIRDPRTSYSVLISAAVSFLGLLATKKVIPVLKTATLRANLFGYDINKKGSEQGEKKIPESLGLAPGVVFLVCIILFQQLHSYDMASVLHSGVCCVGAFALRYALQGIYK